MQRLESYIDEIWTDCWEKAEEPTAEIFGNIAAFIAGAGTSDTLRELK